MPSKHPAQRLQDIIDNIAAARRFTEGLDFDAFAADQRTFYAVVRALEIISEASRRLPDDVKAWHSTIDWSSVATAGNIYRHEYEVVDPRVVWHTITVELAPLERVVRHELSRIEVERGATEGT